MTNWRVKQEAGASLYYVQKKRWWFPFWTKEAVFENLVAAMRYARMGGKKEYYYHYLEDRSALPATGEE